MQDIIKVAFLGIIAVMFAAQFKGSRPEYGTFIILSVGILIFGLAIHQLETVAMEFDKLKFYLGSGEKYLSILVKIICITYVCEFSAGICKDAGYSAVAGQIELLGKLAVLMSGLPILLSVIEQVYRFGGKE